MGILFHLGGGGNGESGYGWYAWDGAGKRENHQRYLFGYARADADRQLGCVGSEKRKCHGVDRRKRKWLRFVHCR